MFLAHILFLFIGCFLLAQPFALPLNTGNTPEVRVIHPTVSATTDLPTIRTLLADTKRHPKKGLQWRQRRGRRQRIRCRIEGRRWRKRRNLHGEWR